MNFPAILLFVTSAAFCGVWPFRMGDVREFKIVDFDRTRGVDSLRIQSQVVTAVDSSVIDGTLYYSFKIVDSSAAFRTEYMGNLSEHYRVPTLNSFLRPSCNTTAWYPDSSNDSSRGVYYRFHFQGEDFRVRRHTCSEIHSTGGPTTSLSTRGTIYTDSTRGILYRVGEKTGPMQPCYGMACYTEIALETLNHKPIDAYRIKLIVDSLSGEGSPVRREGNPPPAARGTPPPAYRLDGRQAKPGHGPLLRPRTKAR